MPKFTGNTIEEAIEKGLSELSLTKDEAKITIVNEGKKGFFGMGKKEAIVEVDKNPAIHLQDTTPKITPEVTSDLEEVAVDAIEEVEDTAETVEVMEEEISNEEVETTSNVPVSSEEALDDEEALKELGLYLTKITQELNAPALLRVERQKEVIIFHLDSQKQGLLIGKHGKVLNALQYLAQVFIHRKAKNKISVVVNVGDYRQRRQEILERLAKRTAEKVQTTRHPVFLEPMPAFERKKIHSVLSKNPYVTTHSEGDEPYRYLVVEPSDKSIL